MERFGTGAYQLVCMRGQSASRSGEALQTTSLIKRTNNDKDRGVAEICSPRACALAGAVSLPGPAGASASGRQNLANEEVLRKWSAAWEKRDWGPVDSLPADDFTFTSAAGDDHLSKSTFKAQWRETQVDFIKHFDLERGAAGA